MDLVSWDFYDKALLGMSCYPSVSDDGIQEPDRVWSHVVKYLRFLEFIVGHYKNKEIFLADLGCADGRFGRTLIENSRPFTKIHYLGIDIRKNIFKCFEKTNSNSTSLFVNANITERIPIDSTSVDIVVLSQVLKYIESKSLFFTLNECRRILKSDGYLLITHSLPSRYDTKNWEGYVGEFSFGKFERAIDKSGFYFTEQFPIECDVGYKDKCTSKALEKYPLLKQLPQPLQVIVGLNILPELAQQMAYFTQPKPKTTVLYGEKS